MCKIKYIGESKKTVLPRCIEHQQDSMSGKYESSGAAEHTKECHGQFDWLHPKTLHISPYMYERKNRKALKNLSLKILVLACAEVDVMYHNINRTISIGIP